MPTKGQHSKESTATSPPKTPTDLLFDAVESGNLDETKTHLASGGDPDARKKVTLIASWKSGEQRLVQEGGVFSKDKYEDVLVTKKESLLGESLLVVAVRLGKEDILEELLAS
ncbi:hypothetical protein HDU93_005631, partial [Gonapodya sp. JEL0774]